MNLLRNITITITVLLTTLLLGACGQGGVGLNGSNKTFSDVTVNEMFETMGLHSENALFYGRVQIDDGNNPSYVLDAGDLFEVTLNNAKLTNNSHHADLELSGTSTLLDLSRPVALFDALALDAGTDLEGDRLRLFFDASVNFILDGVSYSVNMPSNGPSGLKVDIAESCVVDSNTLIDIQISAHFNGDDVLIVHPVATAECVQGEEIVPEPINGEIGEEEGGPGESSSGPIGSCEPGDPEC